MNEAEKSKPSAPKSQARPFAAVRLTLLVWRTRFDRASPFLFLIAITGMASAFYHLLDCARKAPFAYSDVAAKQVWNFARAPGIPYVNKVIEYPVLTGLFIDSMGRISRIRGEYYILTSIFLILFAVIATLFLYHSTKGRGRARLLAYWCVAPSMFFFLVYNWDILAVLSVVVALYFITRERYCLASLFLAIGFSCKFYPAMFLIPLLLKKRTAPDWARILGVFTITAIAINLYFMIASFHGWWYFFSYNSLRPPNPDSIWGIIGHYIWISIPQVNVASWLLFAGVSAILLWKCRF